MWKKIVAPAVLVGLLWIGGGGFTTYYIMWLQTSLAQVLRESMSAVRSAGELEATLWRLQSSVMEAQQNSRQTLLRDGHEAELTIDRTLETAQLDAKSDEERELIAQLSQEFSEYRAAAHESLHNTASGGSDAAPANAESMRRAVAVAERCKEYLALRQRQLIFSLAEHARLTRGVNALRLILFCSGPVIGVLLGAWITRSLRSSIHRLSVRLQDAAHGVEKDLGHVEISPAAELPELEKQVQDVAARLNHAAEELERNRRGAERSDRLAAAGELAAGIAHELRNPLTSLKLLVQAAARKQRDRPLTDKQFTILQDEIDRMEGSIQSLLDLTRPPKMQRRLHNVCDTLRRSLNLVRSRASQNSVRILEGLPNERIMVHGDAEQLHQVFVNLLLNAMEAMPDGGTLRVTIGGISEDDTFCRIKCSDTGTGIPSDLIDRIFDPFVSGKEHGHGLGLAVSRRIVAEHGGSLTAVNRPEGGALFTVAIPFVSVEPEPARPASDPELVVHRSLSDPELVERRPRSDPEVVVQRSISNPELDVQIKRLHSGTRG